MKYDFRPLSIDGLSPFAKGGTGECYRLDEDTILKLYDEEQERLLKRIVLLKKLHFEVLYGKWFPPEYCSAIRDEVLSTFQEGKRE